MAAIDLRLPNITGDQKEQLVQIRSYLYQLVPQLQHALSTIGTSEAQAVAPTPRSLLYTGAGGSGVSGGTANPQATFNSIKSLIIKSAEIVEAYYEEINKRLEGIYVAQSDFGSFVEKTTQDIEINSSSTTQRFENIQVIITNQSEQIGEISGNINTLGEDLSFTQSDILSLGANVEEVAGAVTILESDINILDDDLKKTAEIIEGNINKTSMVLSNAIYDAKKEMSGDINSGIVESKDYTVLVKVHLLLEQKQISKKILMVSKKTSQIR